MLGIMETRPAQEGATMLRIRKSDERGHTNYEWLNSYHTFSFGRYVDRAHVGFRALRVINDDYIAGGAGFSRHGHKDMEIVSYVTGGALEHEDSLGNGSVIRPGDVQLMSAGTGIEHAEFNHLKDTDTHLYQIWIQPREEGLAPSYAETSFDQHELADQLRRIVSPGGEGGALAIHQDVSIFAARLTAGTVIEHALTQGRYGWLQLLSGGIELNDKTLAAGDGAAMEDEANLSIRALEKAEILFFDLA
jgi:quercetin 2,3-dioxygenase